MRWLLHQSVFHKLVINLPVGDGEGGVTSGQEGDQVIVVNNGGAAQVSAMTSLMLINQNVTFRNIIYVNVAHPSMPLKLLFLP